MGLKPEQINDVTFPISPGAKKEAKKQFVRKQRRAAKTDPEGAARKRRYHGWFW